MGRARSRVHGGRLAVGRLGRADDEGAAAVEFALISILLFMLLFGLIQYGMAFFQLQATTHAAREGARLAAVGVSSGPSLSACQQFAKDVADRAGMARADIATVGVDFDPGAVAGATARVRLEWRPRKFGFPFVPFISDDLVDATAESRVESVGSTTSDCPQQAPPP
jgi:Flp pilus assembly protein TadG